MKEISQPSLEIALITFKRLILPVGIPQVSVQRRFGGHLLLADVAFDRHLVSCFVVDHQHVIVEGNFGGERLKGRREVSRID